MRAILTFHSIDDSGSVISYPPARFARLIETLRRSGTSILSLDELLAPGAPQGVALTFDDGMRSMFVHALPVLRAHAAPAHLFLATGAVDRREPWPDQPSSIPSFPMLSWTEVEALAAGGVRIESHTNGHPDLRTLDAPAIQAECDRADALIEARVGRRPEYFAYPFGWFDDRARRVVAARYRAAVTTELGALEGREDPALLPRLDTYYLKSPALYRNLSGAGPRSYFNLRSILRTVRGTQLPARPRWWAPRP